MLDKLVEGLAKYHVVLEPDENVAEWWAGAPSVVRAPDGTFYLAARMRHVDSPKGWRGYEVRLLRSGDGIHFETVARITREAAGVPGFERPALVLDPATGLYRLYECACLDGAWTILRFDDVSDPARFDPATVRPVLQAQAPDDDMVHVHGFKDPVVFHDGARWQMFVIGIDSVERIHHFVSDDGEAWEPGVPAPVLENSGWHDYYTRPASVLPLGVGWLFVYEGSHHDWHDPVYNISTGLAYTPDLKTFHDLTPAAPLLRSTTPGQKHTWRYSQWMWVGDDLYVYFEAARPNNTNETRLAILPRGATTGGCPYGR